MIYEILTRWKATHFTEETEVPDTALISIIDPESFENLFNDQKWIKGILSWSTLFSWQSSPF